MDGIAISHDHEKFKTQRVRKRHRIAVRFTVAIVLVYLPLAEGLNYLQLVATAAGLNIFVIVVDLLGSTCSGDSIWRDRSTCRYSTECKLRRNVENITVNEEDVEDLAKKHVGEMGTYDIS